MNKSMHSEKNSSSKKRHAHAFDPAQIVSDGEELTTQLPEDLTLDGQSIVTRDASFQSELEYDGYKDIEEYDNDEFNANVNSKADERKELNFEDREESPISLDEENITDKQNHKSDLNRADD